MTAQRVRKRSFVLSMLASAILTGAVLAVLIPALASADHQIIDVEITPSEVAPGEEVTIAVTVETDGQGPATRNEWSSTAFSFNGASGLSDHCTNEPSDDVSGAGITTASFTAIAPDELGAHELWLKIWGGVDCGGGQGSGNVRTGVDVIVVDATAPTVTIEQADGQDDPTDASPIHFTVIFSEDVSGFDGNDVDLTGSAGATTAVVSGGPAEYEVAVSGMTNDGLVVATVAADAAEDGSGNLSAASTSSDNTVTYDTNGTTGTIALSDDNGAPTIVGDRLTVTVEDADLNTDAAVAETVAVSVISDSDGTGLTSLTLTETGVDTGIFAASLDLAIATDDGASPPQLAAEADDLVTARYDDALDDDGFDPVPVSAQLTVGQFTLAVDDVTVTEGNSGTSNATFTVTLNVAPQSGQTVSVHVATVDDDATAPGDYGSVSLDLTFSEGETSKPVAVAVVGDTVPEPSESFVVTLSAAVNAAITDAVGSGTILDNDSLPSVSISDTSLTEGDSGTSTATFTVSLSKTSSETVTVFGQTIDGTALNGGDYLATSGLVTFLPGDSVESFSVEIVGDAVAEDTEAFFVGLSLATGATIADSQGTGTVFDNDGAITITVHDASVTEGDSGTRSIAFSVTLSAASSETVTVLAQTTAGTAAAGADYLTAAATLIFTPGDTAESFVVQVIGDEDEEATEQFFVDLSSATNATIADGRATGRILDNDEDDSDPTFDGERPEKGPREKVTICHIPPGNPEKLHTIRVGAPAVDSHLSHGDELGDCEE